MCFSDGHEFQPWLAKGNGNWQSLGGAISDSADRDGLDPSMSDPIGMIVLLVISSDKKHVENIISNLSCERGFKAVGKYIDSPGLIESLIENIRPDHLLFDMELLPALNLEVAQKIRAKNPNIKLILLSRETSSALDERMAVLNIDGYLPIDSPPPLYVKAIHAVNCGEYWLPRWMIVHRYEYLLQNVREQLAIQGVEKPESIHRSLLTERELQVCELVVKGYTNKEIAKTIAISAETVKKHLTNICAKWGVRRRSELATLFTRS